MSLPVLDSQGRVIAGPEGKRCTGHCCKKVGLGLSPEQVHARWKKVATSEYEIDPADEEFLQIASMLVFQRKKDDVDWYYYSCRNHDPVSGNCMIYGDRPTHMCAAYPYGGSCKYDGCTAGFVPEEKEIVEKEDM